MRKALLLLGILNDRDIDWMIEIGAKQTVASGGVLIEEGKPVESVYLVLEGEFAVRTKALGGGIVARLKCGELVGEMSFVDTRPPSASVVATEKSTALVIPRKKLAARLEEDVYFAARFYRAIAVFLSDRLRTTVGLLGYKAGGSLAEEVEYSDEISADALENLALAGARFDLLQRRLRTL